MVKHPNHRRLVAPTGCEEATKLLPALVLGSGTLGGFEILRPSLCGDCCRKIGELLRLLGATVRTADRTGIEMEALTAVAVAALALIDMVKAVDRHARITDVRVTAKSGGRSGDWTEA